MSLSIALAKGHINDCPSLCKYLYTSMLIITLPFLGSIRLRQKYHLTVGLGRPPTAHSSVTFSPSLAENDDIFLVKNAASAKKSVRSFEIF